MKLNVRLIRKVIRHILEEPKRYFQEDIVITGEPGESIWGGDNTLPQCGTAGCIAGWAYLLSAKNPNPNYPYILGNAKKVLGLTDSEAEVLFTGMPESDWPSPFSRQYREASTRRQKAKIASRLLETVIKTRGAILEQDTY